MIAEETLLSAFAIPAATETFNDIRRMKGLGENFVTLANTKKFTLRMPYGNSDVVSNPEEKPLMATVNTYIQSLYGGLAELANLTYII